MNTTDSAPHLRTIAVAFTICGDATTFGRTTLMTAEEERRLRSLLAALQDWGLVLPATFEPALPAYGLDQTICHLCASLGKHVVKAALAALEAGTFPGSDPCPAAVMPVWAFEPEGLDEDVLLSSAHLWGVDFLIEALRVESEDDSEPVPAVRERFARWAAAAGGRRQLATVRPPGRSGSYAVFISPASA